MHYDDHVGMKGNFSFFFLIIWWVYVLKKKKKIKNAKNHIKIHWDLNPEHRSSRTRPALTPYSKH